MGVMRKDDGLVGVVREGVKMEGVMRKGRLWEIVGDGVWKGRVRVAG